MEPTYTYSNDETVNVSLNDDKNETSPLMGTLTNRKRVYYCCSRNNYPGQIGHEVSSFMISVICGIVSLILFKSCNEIWTIKCDNHRNASFGIATFSVMFATVGMGIILARGGSATIARCLRQNSDLIYQPSEGVP